MTKRRSDLRPSRSATRRRSNRQRRRTARRPRPTRSDDAVTEIAYEERFAWADPKRKRRSWGALYATAIPLLLLLLIAQTVFHYRDAVAAYWPATKPVLTRLCDAAGCAIRPLRDVAMNYLSIESSDLQADPAHRGLLILTANVRSHAAWALAYPYLELTLTDAKDDVVVRRALAPADYAGGTADVGSGIAPNGEVQIKLFIDASATRAGGLPPLHVLPMSLRVRGAVEANAANPSNIRDAPNRCGRAQQLAIKLVFTIK